MCLKVNPVKLLVKVHLVLSFAPVFSMVYPDINKINYSPFKRQTLQEWYLGQDVMNISHKYSGKYRKLASERITYSFQVVLLSLITKALHTVFRLPLIFRLPYKNALRSASTNILNIPTRNRQ